MSPRDIELNGFTASAAAALEALDAAEEIVEATVVRLERELPGAAELDRWFAEPQRRAA